MQVWKTELTHGKDNVNPIVYKKLFSVNDVEDAFRNLNGERRCKKGGKRVIDAMKIICMDLNSKSLSFSEIQQAFRGVLNETYWVQKGLINLQHKIKP